MELPPITGTIGLDDSAAVAAERRVVAEARAMKQGVESQSRDAAHAMEGHFKKSLDKIKEDFGKRSAFGESIELLAGGGVIAGVGLAADQFDKFSSSIAKAANAMREEDAHMGQVAGDFLRDIPLIGSVVKGFDSLRDAITGESAALAAQDENSARSLAAWKAHEAALIANKKAAEDFNKEMRSLQETLDVIRAPAAMQDEIRGNQGTANRRDDAQAKVDADAKALKDLETQLAAAKSAQAAAQEASDASHAKNASNPLLDVINPGVAALRAIGTDDNTGKDLDKTITNTRVLQQQWSDARDAMSAAKNELDKITAVTESIDAVNSQKKYANVWTDLNKSFQDVAKNSEKVWNQMDASILADMKRTADAAKALKQEGDALTKSLRTPDEVYGDSLQELKKLQDAGDISNETYLRGQTQALRQFNEQMDHGSRTGGRNQAEDVWGTRTVRENDVSRDILDVSKQQLAQLNKVVTNTDPSRQQVIEVVSLPGAG